MAEWYLHASQYVTCDLNETSGSNGVNESSTSNLGVACECPLGASCPRGSTLETLQLERGQYRHTMYSVELSLCDTKHECPGGSSWATSPAASILTFSTLNATRELNESTPNANPIENGTSSISNESGSPQQQCTRFMYNCTAGYTAPLWYVKVQIF